MIERQFGAVSTLAQFTYNSQHRPLYYTDAAGRTTTFEYNQVGQLTSTSNALGEQTSYQYDANSNLISITNANSANAGSYTYDSYSRVRTFTDSEGWAVSYDYDAADRITKVTYPDGTAAKYAYDKLDLASYKDREGRLWKYDHDANRRLTKVIDPMSHQTLLGYNERGQLVTLTDPKGNRTVWSYDVQGRATTKTYADESSVSYTYEATTSRLKSSLDALGQTKRYDYGPDDQVVSLTYLNAVNPTANVNFAYDLYFPRLASMTDGVGTTTYSYYPSFADGAQQPQAECFTAMGENGCSTKIDYAYDVLGRSISRAIDGAGPETFTYDAIGRVAEHSSDLGLFSLSYLGQTEQLEHRQLLQTGSSLATSWSYLDNTHDRRLAGINNAGLAPGQFTNFAFMTTPENFFTGITQTSDASVSTPGPSIQMASVNNLNQLTTVNSQPYSYDTNGNLLSDGQRNYSWDAENRLIKITYPAEPGKQTHFTYDGFGRRVAIVRTPTGGGTNTTTSYLWCNDRVCQARNAAGSPQRSYFEEGEFVSGSPNQPLYYGVDQIGSVRRVFASASSAPATDYDPFGVPLQATAPITDFGFAGMISSADIGLGLTWYRAYDPVNGRWFSRDPLTQLDPADLGSADGPQLPALASLYLNAYTYAANNPTSKTDPMGLAPKDNLYGMPGSFWNWFHQSGDMECEKGPNGQVPRPVALDYYKIWKDAGMPKPGKK